MDPWWVLVQKLNAASGRESSSLAPTRSIDFSLAAFVRMAHVASTTGTIGASGGGERMGKEVSPGLVGLSSGLPSALSYARVITGFS